MSEERSLLLAMGRNRWWRLVALLAVLAIAVTAALGGFRRAGGPRHVYPEAGFGQRVETGALAVTPVCAWISAGRPGRPPDPAGKRYLVLRLRAENLTDSALASGFYLKEDVVWLSDGATEPKPADLMQRADDQNFDVLLQPRLPTRVDLAWELPAAAAPPPVWGVYRRDYVARTYLTGEDAWINRRPDTKLRLRIDDRCAKEGST